MMHMRNHRGAPSVATIVCGLLGCSLFVLDLRGQSPSVPNASPDPVVEAPANAGAPASPVGQRHVLKARLEQMYATADFNGDGLQDIALVDFLTDSVKVMLADAAGTFTASPSLSAKRGPRSIVAADFNADGVIDLAVGAFLSGEIRVFSGLGDGRFGAPRVVQMTAGISSLVEQDVDGDSHSDIVAANGLSGAVLVLRNAGDGSFDEPAEIGRSGAVTVLSIDVDGDGFRDLATIDAQGVDARVFAGRGAGQFDSATPVDVARVLSAADAGGARTTTASVSRLRKIAGDGVAPAGAATPEALVIEVRDSTGTAFAGDGHVVVFSRVGGNAESAEPGALPGEVQDVRATDALGRASLALSLPDLPDVSVIAAALPAEQAEHFGVLSVLPQPELSKAIEAALRLDAVDAIEMAERVGFVQQASQRLTEGDAIGGVRSLRGLLDQLPSSKGGSSDAAVGRAADLSRRLVNQVLLTGVGSDEADDEALVCDVPLTRTIATPDEIDRFSFACAGGERVHIILGNEGGSFNYAPVWRLLASDGTPAAVCGDLASGERECELPAGTYTVEVRDDLFNGTGSYSLQLQRLTEAQRCAAAPLVCDTPVTTTISHIVDTDLYNFTSVAGERVHIILGNEGGSFNYAPVWRLLAADGTPAAVCGALAAGERECAPPAGTYAVEVRDNLFNGTGTYSLQLQRLTEAQRCAAAPLVCDTPVTATISHIVDTDLYNFTSVAGERVHVILGNEGGSFNYAPVWRLLASNGMPAAVCGALAAGERECAPPAGTYAVEVRDDLFNGTGSYSLQLQRLTEAQRCAAAPLVCDTPVTTTISHIVDTDLYNFTSVAGERVHIILGNEGGSFNYAPVWRLLASNGTPAVVCGDLASGERECAPPAGTYAVEVRDNLFNGTGTYSLQLQRLTEAQRCAAAPLVCDTPVTATISHIVDTDLYNFVSVAGERVHIILGNEGGSFNYAPVWRLLASNGMPAAVCGDLSTGERECAPPAGTYAVEVRDNLFNGTGSYSLQLQRLTEAQRCGAAPLVCGTPVTTTISHIVDTDLYSFTGVEGGSVHVSLVSLGGSFNFGPQWRLIAPSGAAAAVCGTLSGAGEFDCTIPSAGTYAVEVRDGGFNGTGTYRLTVSGDGCTNETSPTVSVSAIEPSAIEAGLDPGVFRLSRTGSTGSALTVGYTVGGTATSGTDYSTLSGSAVIPSGESFTDVPVTPLSDTLKEVDETVILTLTGSAAYLVGAPGSATVTLTEGPDLTISALSASSRANPGDTINVKVSTKNRGTQPTGPTTTRIWLSSNKTVGVGDELLASYDVAALAPNVTSTKTTAVTIPLTTPLSNRFLIAQADGLNVQADANQSNDIRTRAITIGPNYSVSVLSTVPTNIAPGAAFAINDTTKNGGTAVAIATTTEFYLSADKTFSPATDVLLTQRTVPPLNGGQSSTASTPATMPAGTTPGKKYIIAFADALNQVAEASETQNRRSVAVTVP